MVELKERPEDKLAAFLQEYEKELQKLADELRTEELPQITEELFALFETTGNRLRYEEVYFGRRKFLTVFGAVSCLYGRREDLARLEEVILDICAEECWALPAHVNRKTDPDWRIAVDLFAAETAQTLAELTYRLKDMLNPRICELVRREVLRRVLDPFLASPVPYPRWEHNYSNWNAVCGGCVGYAAACLLEDRPDVRTACLERVTASIQSYYLEGFGSDGACMEGLSYWTYGFSYYVLFADMIYQISGGEADLMAGEKLKQIAQFQQKCYFPHGRTVSFSDGDRKGSFRIGLTSRLALRYVDGNGISMIRFPDIACACGVRDDTCWRFAEIYRDVIWTRELLMQVRAGRVRILSAEEEKGQETFEDAQWVICRGEKEISFAAKGGTNDEPHNHNDIGSFLYLYGEDEILADLGSGEYTKDYFSEKRYTVFCNSSESHNVPIIDGQFQREGEDSVCGLFTTDGNGRITLEYAEAYGNPALRELTRQLAFSEADGSLTVEDCFTADRPLVIRENLVTQLPVTMETGSCVRIHASKGDVLIQIEGILGEIMFQQRTHRSHSGREEQATLIQWKVPQEKFCYKTKFCVSVIF